MTLLSNAYRSGWIGLVSMSFFIVLVASWGAPAHANPERWAELDNCELLTAGGRLSVEAMCGTLQVPENPAAPDGQQLELAWAVMPALLGAVEPDPVVFLAGGPGQSAREMAPIMASAFRNINRNRDLIFLDQRGTGGSNALNCEFQGFDLLTEPDMQELNQQLRRCMDENGALLEHYTTQDGADDLELLRQHIGADQLNLVGGSYGTRMAQVYLRSYPEHVRSVVIDGVVPTRLKLGAEHADKLDQSLEKLFAACQAQTECNRQFPGLSDAFEQIKQRYASEPIEIQVTHPRTGVAEPVLFNLETLAGSLRFLAYSPSSQMMIPYLVHEAAATGNPERLAAQGLIQGEQLTEVIAIGLNFSVGCSEDWPHWPQGQDSSGTLMGNAMRDLYAEVCQWWPADPVDTSFHTPFDSDAPVLVLSGEFDPVTPPEYGDEAAAQFSNSRHLVATGRGHIVTTNPCISGIVNDFIAAGDLADLDTECMATIGPEPFFLNLLGPSP